MTDLSERPAGPGHGPDETGDDQPLRRPRGPGRALPAESAPRTRERPAPGSGLTPATGLTGPLRQLLGPVTGSLRLLGRQGDTAAQSLRVDWPQCKAHGLCHEIAPEVIHLDEWGYPLFEGHPLSGDALAAVRRAVQVCPTLALRLAEAPPGA